MPPVKRSFRTVYVQNFSGVQFKTVRIIFLDTLKRYSDYKVTEILPDDFKNLAIIRVHVTDYSFWENEENLIPSKVSVNSEEDDIDIMLRRNVLVGMHITLFDAESGDIILRKQFTQAFQQIYIGADKVAARHSREEEVQRLIRRLIGEMLDILYSEKKVIDKDLRAGEGGTVFDRVLLNTGDSRLQKGINYALVGEYDQAILVWKIVVFTPKDDEPEEIYQRNRARAFYNMGQIYSLQNKPWLAAKMYSQANRIQQKLKYAQSWSDNMHVWLVNKEKKTKQKEDNSSRNMVLGSQQRLKHDQTTDIKRIDENQDLLLNPRLLWPLEQKLKAKEKQESTTSPTSDGKETKKSTESESSEPEPIRLKPMETEPVKLEPSEPEAMDLEPTELEPLELKN
jgi:tetratricopeptide (TPR) repeat protein